MAKILGLDLGTNSIGWAIRENDKAERKDFLEKFKQLQILDDDEMLTNEIIDYGVIVFEKGVGDGKSGEYSLAAERRKNRSKRRLYNAKRYRKWALLKLLVENRMCPLKPEELRLWSVGDWQKGERNKGRIYPSSIDFRRWLAMDFDKIGKEYSDDEKLKPEFDNTYLLRCHLLENNLTETENTKNKIGRALYHLAQRRGFKTSRKSGKSGYAKNEEIEKAKLENNELQLSQFINQKYFKQEQRFRASGVIQRKYYEEEFLTICNKQKLDKELTKKLFDAVYFVRPLRTQKGLVGKCTMETNKPRIPISHPAFEEYRALAFINNIQWRETGSDKEFKSIEISLKKKIFEQLFFRRSKAYFPFEEIVSRFSENNKYEFNYAKYDEKKLKEESKYELVANPSVSTCPVIAGLMNVFNEEWKNKFIADENKVGIDWSNLSLSYKIKYVSKKENGKGLKRKGKKFIEREIGKEVNLDYEGIWHLLFDYLQIKDKEDDLKKFCKEVIGWNDEEKIKQFVEIVIEQGYGSLSRNAISKILPYLQDGNIYTEAVFYANLSKVLGEKYFLENKEKIKEDIKITIEQIDKQKEKLEIVNGLIQKYFGEVESIRAKGLDSIIKQQAEKDVEKKLKGFFGADNWNRKSEKDQNECYDFVLEKYLNFLDGKQLPEEKASFRKGKNPEIDYYKLPRLDDAIKQILRDKFSATEKGLEHLYHPSDIDVYPKSKTTKQIIDKETGEILRIVPQLESPVPPSRGWKNPMAMRTMYELKYLVNYLLQIGKIDAETKIVIEIARELNDANRRKALEYWKNDKEAENQEYANAILETFNISNPSDDDYNKFKTAVEQLTNYTFSENKEQIFKKKYDEFVKTYITGEIQKEKDEDDEIIGDASDENEKIRYDYLMYLILTRDNFIRLLSSKIPNSKKVIKQVIKPVKDFQAKRNSLKETITKYRLWKQQQFQCFYTGRHIPFSDLFDGTKCQIEHTIPRSISFDTELKNLTVCDAVYNAQVKNNQFPTECPNYSETKKCKTVEGEKDCAPISKRVERLIKPKVDELKKRIENLKATSKKIPSWEKAKKDANIRLRHYLKFELEYWERKLLTFTVERKDWKDKWKNSQLVDTQIISKYARAYMKTVFYHADVVKAKRNFDDEQTGTVNTFRSIYGIGRKNRARHSHHAIDAAVLTLIPNSAQREELLREYYLADEQHKRISAIPYPDFTREHVVSIDQNVLINHITRDKTLAETKKKMRKRGKVQYRIVEQLPKNFRNKIEGTDYFKVTKDGKEQFKIPKLLEGDSIRGQLHEETFLGTIKVTNRNEQGYAIKENGKYKIQQVKGEDVKWIVVRKKISDVDISKDKVVDELLKKHLEKQLTAGLSISEVVDFSNKRIRHLRCAVKAGRGFLTPQKAIELKRHLHPSKYQHKEFVLAKQDENFLYLLYEKANKSNTTRKARIVSLFEFADSELLHIKGVWQDRGYNQGDEMLLTKIIKVGQKAIFFSGSKEELKERNKVEFKKRVFVVYKFNESGTPDIYLKNNIEARPNSEIDKLCENIFNPNKYQAGLSLKAEKLNCVFEGEHFELKPDGTINWKF